jgi:hypothetical protein
MTLLVAPQAQQFYSTNGRLCLLWMVLHKQQATNVCLCASSTYSFTPFQCPFTVALTLARFAALSSLEGPATVAKTLLSLAPWVAQKQIGSILCGSEAQGTKKLND